MKIRIIGCGAMGAAIAHTLVENGKEVWLYDKHRERAEGLSRAIRAQICEDPLEDFSYEDILLIAVKPQDFLSLAKELQALEGGLVASIMAGVSCEQLKQAFPHSKILRMMPNLAVRYGDGIVAMAENPELLSHHKTIEDVFSPLGIIRWIPERLFSSITALTGSGPAFVFLLIEAMVDASIELGFSAEMGYDLVKQMVGGALTMLYESHESPTDLRWRTCSAAGTTIAGVRALEAHGVRTALIEGFVASMKRAESLTKENH